MIPALDRWTLTCWRKAHPALWLALAGALWGAGDVWSLDQWSWDEASSAVSTIWLAAAGFLAVWLMDGEGWTPSGHAYLQSRPVSRMGTLRRTLALPLLVAGVAFVIAPAVVRDYWVGRWYRQWTNVQLVASQSEWNRLAFVPERKLLEAYRVEGHRVFEWRFERWRLHPELLRDARNRAAKVPRTPRWKVSREADTEAFRDFAVYERWVAGVGAMPNRVARNGGYAVLRFPEAWISWAISWLAFALGALLRAAMTHGGQSGAAGALRRLAAPRNLIPFLLVSPVSVAILVRWGGWRSMPHGYGFPRAILVHVYDHTVLACGLVLLAGGAAWILLARGWLRRDIA